MQRIGFIGLGIMGYPMAKNMLPAAEQLLVYDLNAASVEKAVTAGAKAASLSQIAEKCSIIFMSLPNGPIVESVLFGKDGLAGMLRPDTLVCDLSSTEFSEARSFGSRLDALKIDFLDAPVSGGEPKAKSGELSVMVGGDERCFNAVRKYLESICTSISFIGAQGSGCAAKLINQILVNVNIAAVCEAYAFAEKLGLDVETIYKAVGDGSASSAMLHNRTPKLLKRDFKPGAKVSIMHKDIRNVLAAAQDVDMPLPLTAVVFDLFKAARSARFSDDDVTRLFTIYERLASVAE